MEVRKSHLSMNQPQDNTKWSSWVCSQPKTWGYAKLHCSPWWFCLVGQFTPASQVTPSLTLSTASTSLLTTQSWAFPLSMSWPSKHFLEAEVNVVCCRDCISWTQSYSEALERTTQTPRCSSHLIPSPGTHWFTWPCAKQRTPKVSGISQRLLKYKHWLTLSSQTILAQRADYDGAVSSQPNSPHMASGHWWLLQPWESSHPKASTPPRQHLQIHLVLSHPCGRATRWNSGTAETKLNLATK